MLIRAIRVRFLVFLVFARLCCKPEAVDKRGKEWLSLLKQGLPGLRDICAACSTGEGFHGFCVFMVKFTGYRLRVTVLEFRV